LRCYKEYCHLGCDTKVCYTVTKLIIQDQDNYVKIKYPLYQLLKYIYFHLHLYTVTEFFNTESCYKYEHMNLKKKNLTSYSSVCVCVCVCVCLFFFKAILSTPMMTYCQNSQQNIIRIYTTKHTSCNKQLVFIPLCTSGTYQPHKIQ